MMIVDFHAHIFMRKLLSKKAEKRWGDQLDKVGFEPTADKLIKDMDEAGIDKCVVQMPDWSSVLGVVTSNGSYFRQYQWNDWVAESVKKYPNRLIGFAGIDPTRGVEAIEEIERCVESLGLKGLKLYPTGWYPHDQRIAYPVYRKAEELGIPVQFHTGGIPPGGRVRFARPMYLSDVAEDFPNLTIIMSHLAPWPQEAISAVSNHHPNMYLDITAYPGRIGISPTDFYTTIVQLYTRIPDQIVLGSDWPYLTRILTQKELVTLFKEMKIPKPLLESGLPDITEENTRKILGDNARKLLNL